MDTFYGIALSLLLFFAIFDLIIGVGNDAVNFLNSAIGSKVASRSTIMSFASIGILLGALFSNGMMEIARKGIFNPSYFNFYDLFCIFLSVMIADIVLLDIFNTLGLPTSTTVSIVFSLLGASFIIALTKIVNNKDSFFSLINYINATRTLSMISGIFLSIIISFIFGSIVHYFIRCVFSFDYNKKIKNFGSIWSGISLTSMTYFLIIEGLHGSIKDINITNKSIISLYYLNKLFIWINNNFIVFIITLFLLWTLISFILTNILEFNIFKIIVLYGTFSLAMAFSGNDLVNFIGVPIAGFQSYLIWIDANTPNPENLYMENLSKNIQISPIVLIIAGIIMILTIWFSKKVTSVSDTEINLGRQNYEEKEKYSSNILSRKIVKYFLLIGKYFLKIFSKRFLVKLEKNFKHKINLKNSASFDLVRASANLTISSIIISLATAKKLPLSTTFVTFMVSMGTSLSDRAWDRDTAVYRVSGVLKVISGWFLTGLIAFFMSSIFSIFLYIFNFFAIIILILIVSLIIYKNYNRYKIYELKKYKKTKNIITLESIDIDIFVKNIHHSLMLLLDSMNHIYDINTKCISDEDVKLAKSNKKFYIDIHEEFDNYQNSIITIISNNKIINNNIILNCIKIYNEADKIIEALGSITDSTLKYIINSHKPLSKNQLKKISFLKQVIIDYIIILKKILSSNNIIEIEYIINNKFINITEEIDKQINYQINGMINHKYSKKNTNLVLNVIFKTKNIIDSIEKIILLYNNIYK